MSTRCRFLCLFSIALLGLGVLLGCGGGGGGGCPSFTSGFSEGSSTAPASGVVHASACAFVPGGNDSIAALLYYIGTNNVLGASLSRTGTFAALSSFTPPTLSSSTLNSMAIVNQQFLYVPVPGLSKIEAFAINRSTGALTAITGSPFLTQAVADTLATDPNGHFLFVGGRLSASISVFRIDSGTGALSPVQGSPFQSFNVFFSDSLTVDGKGRFLYVGQTFPANPVVVFSIDPNTGSLSEIAGSPFPLGVAVLQADPSGKFLLGVADKNGTSGDKHVHVFSIASSGAPTPVASSPFATISTPFALTIHPSGKFVYPSVADSKGLTTALEGYALDVNNGTLTAVSGSPFIGIPPVSHCQSEQSGSNMFCVSTTGFFVLNVNPSTGTLSQTVPELAAPNTLPFAVTN